MIYIAGITIAVFIEVLLISKKNKSVSDIILTCWVFLMAYHLFVFHVWDSGLGRDFSFLLGTQFPISFLHSVCLYLYVASLTNQFPRNNYVLFAHFVPATTTYIYLMPFFLLPAEDKISVFERKGQGYETFMVILMISQVVAAISYISWSLLALKRYRLKILDNFSSVEKINLQWLRLLIWGMSVIWITVIFASDEWTFGLFALFILALAFFGVKQVGINLPNSESIENDTQSKEKYAKSGLNEGTSVRLYSDLRNLMTTEKLYRNGELSLNELALQLDVQSNYLSQVINEKEGKNFYEFVNTYRLEDFKEKVSDPTKQHLTLLSLALESGFNSKSAFNRFFKKSTGKTPSEFYKSVMKGNDS